MRDVQDHDEPEFSMRDVEPFDAILPHDMDFYDPREEGGVLMSSTPDSEMWRMPDGSTCFIDGDGVHIENL